jgi:transposase
MMGTKVRHFTPLPAVSLDELVPADHFYRHLDRALDLSFVRDLVQDCYVAGVGRPSIDPVVFFRLQLVMFFEGIRSERLLMRTVADRLSVLWYLGYNVGEPLPDHSSLTRIRTRFGLAVFRRFFEAIVEQCQQAGLVWGRELYFDATHVLADASLDSLVPRFAVEARQALQAHLTALFSEGQDSAEDGQSTNPVPRVCATAEEASLAAPPDPEAPIPLSVALTDDQRQKLAEANAARHDWIAEEGHPQREVHGLYQRTADVRISTTDPDATPLRLKGGGTHLGYQTHYAIDGGRKRIILGVLVAPGEVMEHQPMLAQAWHVRFRFHLHPRQATGDTKYGTLENIRALEAMGIRAYMPLFDEWNRHPEFYGTAQFTYDAEQDVYRCPQGQVLLRRCTEYEAEKVKYRADAAICNACPVKEACTPGTQGRIVHRSFHAAVQERVRAYQQTPDYEKALRKRQVWVEPLFAEGKQWHGMRRFRLRRLWRVNCEALLIASGQNLKRLLQQRGWGRRPFPGGAAAAADALSLLSCWVVAVVDASIAGRFRDLFPRLATHQTQPAA